MPTYEYACTACDDRLEVVQKFTDDPLTECPSCKGRLRKIFSPVGVVFKGSGFYRTDSRSSGNGESGRASANGKASSDGSDSSGKSAGGSDSSTSSAASSGSSSSTSSSGSGASGSSGSSGKKEKVA